MSKKLWGGLIIALFACWLGLKSSPEHSENHNSRHSAVPISAPSGTRAADITALTSANQVAAWIHQHHRLPDFYIRKGEARRQGWDPSAANLCDVLPGKAIGGDHFSNREGRLPEVASRRWFEADVNYQCGHRNADRLLYSSDGLVYLTTDHYRTFTRIP
ncbi:MULTISPECIES: ribonuclease domain-containing protein [Tatumella]|uniref:Ribonuclease n=1 Tax=Tatumella punctata TaxID=399969 RepID=A0ABW1VLR4_9GAMM|nr:MULTISPECIES: ribonuclease domain-containing protein [unclassified Tatumella]MBS0855073.1 hypothetical protein [Tatumella sp. JGM16]MBS0911968.1 hypothetical protein [Tatumella sp. JGM91]